MVNSGLSLHRKETIIFEPNFGVGVPIFYIFLGGWSHNVFIPPLVMTSAKNRTEFLKRTFFFDSFRPENIKYKKMKDSMVSSDYF